jgi:hypothetical protein
VFVTVPTLHVGDESVVILPEEVLSTSCLLFLGLWWTGVKI